jgi:Rieske Fe-S protein
VNLVESCFACPCHNARFEYSGTRINPHANPALRGMDELAWQRDSEDRERILVRYENFRAATAEKTTIQ